MFQISATCSKSLISVQTMKRLELVNFSEKREFKDIYVYLRDDFLLRSDFR